MHVVRAAEAPPYQAPGHTAMAMRRLQGREAGPSDSVWLGLSVIEPGGGTTLDASAVEKFYVVLEGTVEMTAARDGREASARLHAHDSVRFEAGEARRLANPGPGRAVVLLVMPLPPVPQA